MAYPKEGIVTDPKWVIREKYIEGKRIKKARLVARRCKQCHRNYEM